MTPEARRERAQALAEAHEKHQGTYAERVRAQVALLLSFAAEVQGEGVQEAAQGEAGRGICIARGQPAMAHVIPAGSTRCTTCGRDFSRAAQPPGTPPAGDGGREKQ